MPFLKRSKTNIKKVLINYNYDYYPFTTASYYELSLRNDPRFSVYRRGDIGARDCDLVLNIEPVSMFIRARKGITAYYEIDNHVIKGEDKHFYDRADIVFVAQRYAVENYPQNKTYVIPLACYPPFHRPFPKEKKIYDIGFLGNDNYSFRNRMLNNLGDHFNLLRSTEKPGIPYSRSLSRCRLAFNTTMEFDVNMRFFEAMAIGRPLITEYIPELDEFAEADTHYKPFNNWRELKRAVEHYKIYPEAYEKMAARASRMCRLKYTYARRFDQMLECINKFKLKK